MSKSAHPKDTARKLRNRDTAAQLRADGWKLADIAKEIGISNGAVHNYLAEAKQEANRRAGDLGEQIRAQEDVRLLEIIDRSLTSADAVAGQTDKHGVPIDHKGVAALGTVLRASESRRRLYGVDAPAHITTTWQPEMTMKKLQRSSTSWVATATRPLDTAGREFISIRDDRANT